MYLFCITMVCFPATKQTNKQKTFLDFCLKKNEEKNIHRFAHIDFIAVFKAVSAKPACSTVTLAHRDALAYFFFQGDTDNLMLPKSSTKHLHSFHVAHLCLAHVAHIIHMVIFLRADFSFCFHFSLCPCLYSYRKSHINWTVKQKAEELQWTHFTPSSAKWPCEAMYKKTSYFSL